MENQETQQETTTEKLYAEMQEIQLDSKNYPKEYPLVWIACTSEINEIKGLFLQARMLGMDPSIRKATFSNNGQEGLKYSSIFEKLSNFDTEEFEVQEDIYRIYKDIPAWNPFNDLKMILEEYINQIKLIRAHNDEVREEIERKFAEMEKNIQELSEEEILEMEEQAGAIDASQSETQIEEALVTAEETSSERARKVTLE